MSETTQRWQGFLIFPGSVEEIEEDGDFARQWDEPTLYDDLVLAGYPISKDSIGGRTDFIDLSVNPDDPRAVTVYGCHPAGEYDMGPVADLFLAWYHGHA